METEYKSIYSKDKNFTFKTEKPTGKFSSFYNSYHYIKYKGKSVGTIEDKTFKISLHVLKTEEDRKKVNDNPKTNWKWITLKKESKTLDEAKQFLKEKVEILFEKYQIIQLD